MKRKYDIIIPIDYANPEYEPCLPPLGTKIHASFMMTDQVPTLEEIARSMTYSIKNEYYRKPVDEEYKKEIMH